VKLVRLRRPKAIYYPSYVDYRLKRNAAILWDKGHTKGRSCTRGMVKRKETKNLNVINVVTVWD
jgi:hypothetical protein